MAEAFELATGYISLSISTRDLGKQIVRGFAGADIAARLAGDKAGSAFSRAFGQKGKFDIKASDNQAAVDVDRAAKRVATAREKERKATAQVKIEEQRLAEVRDKGDAKASELMRAEERLRQAQVKQAAAADELEDQTRQAAAAQDDLEDKSTRAERAGSRGAKVWGGLKKVGKAAGVA